MVTFNKVELSTDLDGKVEWEDLFSLAVGRLGWSPSEFYESTPNEIYLAVTGREAADRDFFELMAHTISVGYARTQTKKKIELFEKKSKIGNIDPERKKKELAFLQEGFGT